MKRDTTVMSANEHNFYLKDFNIMDTTGNVFKIRHDIFYDLFEINILDQ